MIQGVDPLHETEAIPEVARGHAHPTHASHLLTWSGEQSGSDP